MFQPDAALTDHAFDLCQRLIRLDTRNPPGNEIVAADPYQTAVDLEAAQLQLESLFTITARLSRLTLTEFIR